MGADFSSGRGGESDAAWCLAEDFSPDYGKMR